MRTIEVSKTRLAETLSQNREAHRELFLKAQQVFRDKVIEVLDERLKSAREGKPISLYINLPEPVDYTKEFDTALAMVEWAEGDTIELDQRDFARYVLNQWEWQQNFAASTMRYVTGDVQEEP